LAVVEPHAVEYAVDLFADSSAAAVKWYEREYVSQGRAAEIAGVLRAEFVEALGRYGITPFRAGPMGDPARTALARGYD